MRILHFADLHLGVENYNSGFDSETGLSLRLHDFLNAFDEVVEYAVDENIDLVLFCGDAYKSREPSQTHQREFARRVWRMASAGIPVFLLTGNHDLPNAIGRATTLEIFRTLEIQNVTVANKPGTYRVHTNAGPLQVVALPWARKNALLNREETKNLAPDEINERMESILSGCLDREIANLDADIPAVLAAHACLSSVTYGSERSMIIGHDYVLLQSNVTRPEFSYVALGHIHKKQVLGDDPPVVYPGSLQRIDFGEEDDEKGFFVVDISAGRQTTYEFQPVKARRFLTIKVNIGPQETEPTAAVLREIGRRDVTDSIVRVQISVPEHLDHLLSDAEIRKALTDAFNIAAVARDVQRENLPRMPVSSIEELEPIEALKAYLQVKKPRIAPETLMEYGERLIRESDVET